MKTKLNLEDPKKKKLFKNNDQNNPELVGMSMESKQIHYTFLKERSSNKEFQTEGE